MITTYKDYMPQIYAAYPEMDKVLQICKMFNINIDELNNNIINYLKITNFKSSIAQPIKSIIINGTEKSLNYLKEKRKKGKCL